MMTVTMMMVVLVMVVVRMIMRMRTMMVVIMMMRIRTKMTMIRSSNKITDLDSAIEFAKVTAAKGTESLMGAANNIKGIAHELIYVKTENEDGDTVFAFMPEDTNNPQFDVLTINLETGEMKFFDSVGDRAPSNVKKFCNMVKKQAEKSSYDLPEFIFEEGYPNSHQKKNTECGIYSLYFIQNMIEKNNFSFFKNEKIKDEDMQKFRTYFFNK